MPCGPSPLLQTCARRWTSLSRIELGRRFRYITEAVCTSFGGETELTMGPATRSSLACPCFPRSVALVILMEG